MVKLFLHDLCMIIIVSYTDLAGALACSRVYPQVTHLLCIWHVDR